MKHFYVVIFCLVSLGLAEKLEFKSTGKLDKIDGMYFIYFVEDDVKLCFSCIDDVNGEFAVYSKVDSVFLSCVPVVSGGDNYNEIKKINKFLPEKNVSTWGIFKKKNPKYFEALESQRDILEAELGVSIKTIDVYKKENSKLFKNNTGLENSINEYKKQVQNYRKQLDEAVKPGEPGKFILARAKKLNVAPYGKGRDPLEGIKVLGLPLQIEKYFYEQWKKREFSLDSLERGDFLEAMSYRSSKRGVIAVGNFLADWPDSIKYKVRVYEPVEFYGKIFQFGIADTCGNPFYRYVFNNCVSDTIIVKDTVVIKDTIVARDTVCPPVQRESFSGEVEPEEELWHKIQSDAYTGVAIPVPGPRYFNAWLGGVFEYYFPKDKKSGYSKPHLGMVASLNGWLGRGLPDSSLLLYRGFEADVGFKVVFPVKRVAFSIGASYGFQYDKCTVSKYKGRQATYLAIIRETFDIYGRKVELLSYGQFTYGFRGFNLSSWDGQRLTRLEDPATVRSSIYLGAKLFFGSKMKMTTVADISGDGFAMIPATRKMNPGIFILQGIQYEGILSRKLDETKAYLVSFGPSFRFNRPKIIFCLGAKYAWSFERYPNKWAVVASLEKNIVRKVWDSKKNPKNISF